MPTQLGKMDKYATIWYHSDLNVVRLEWHHNAAPLEIVSQTWKELINPHVEQHEVNVIIADMSNTKSVFFPDTIEWWGKENVPRLHDLGVRDIITISSSSFLSNNANKKWQGVLGGINNYEVGSLDECLNIIQSGFREEVAG